MQVVRHVAWYIVCFLIGAALGLIPIWIVEVLENTDDSLAATIVAIGREMNWVVVISAAFSYVAVEGISMIAEIWLRHREEVGREKGREEEREQLVSRFENMTPDERLEEIERLIAESKRANRRLW